MRGCPHVVLSAWGARPYNLRHSFVSLLIHEGRSVVEVAQQAGHSPTMTLDVYAHVFDEFDIAERVCRGSDCPGAARCVRFVSAWLEHGAGNTGNPC
jgi:hypothetical protein